MFPGRVPDTAARELKNKQIKSWVGSETDRASSEYRPPKNIKFPLGVSLIAACYTKDQEEFKRLLDLGVDINTRNPGGLTCVHLCCINGDYEFLEFLIKEGADVNIQDNDGWTPLHAASSFGSEELVRLLLEHGADVSIFSCETELPVDLSQNNSVTKLLTEAMQLKRVDPDQVRQTEAQLLLRDAKHWLEIGRCDYVIDPRTGASPLHVAACKDYTDVLEVLLKIPGLDIDCQDHDGWTALHAAAHWNHEQSVRLLVDAGASLDVYTFTNQSVLDVADQEMTPLLRQLRERQRAAKRNAPTVPKPTLANLQPSKPILPDDASDASNERSVDGSTDEETTDNSGEEMEEEEKSTITRPNAVATSVTFSNDLPVKPVTTAAAGDACGISEEITPLPREQKKLTEDTKQSIPSRAAASSAFSASSNPVLTSPDMLESNSTEQKTPNFTRVDVEPKDSKYSESVINKKLPREPTPPTSTSDSIQSGVSKGSSLVNGLHEIGPTNPLVESKPEIVSKLTFANGSRSTVSPLSPTSLSEPISTVSVGVVERTAVSDRTNAMRSLKASKEHSPPPPVPPTPLKGPTVNSNRIVTIRRRQIPPTPVDSQLFTTLSSVDPSKGDKGNAAAKPSEDISNVRRVSLLMSPSKSAESETQRSIKARYVRSTRRSTQGVSAEEVEEAKKLIEKNNSAAITSEASTIDGSDQLVSTTASRPVPDRSNLRATRATARSYFNPDLVEQERQPAWKSSTRPFDSSTAATTNTIASTPTTDSVLSSTTPVIPIGKAVDSLKMLLLPYVLLRLSPTSVGIIAFQLHVSFCLTAVEPASGGYLVSDSRRAHQSQPRGTRDWTTKVGVFESSDADRPYSRRPVTCTRTTAPNPSDYTTSAYYGTLSHASPPVTSSAVLPNDVNASAPVIPRVYRGYQNETNVADRTNSFGAKDSNPLSSSALFSSEPAVEPASGGYLVSDSRRAHQSQPRGTRDWTTKVGVFESSDADRPYSRRPVTCTRTTAPNPSDYTTSAYYGTLSHASPPVTSSAVLPNDVNASAPVIPRPSSRFLHQNDTSCTTSQAQHNRTDVHTPSSIFPWNATKKTDPVTNSTIPVTSSTAAVTTAATKIATVSRQASLPSSSIPYAHSQVSTDVSRSTARDRFALISQTTDYRRLYEREKVEKERLARELDRINRENANLRLQLSRLRADDDTHTSGTIAPTPNDKSSIVDEELSRLREENAKMKEENGALIRVISKLSKPT
ncbi:hypothetical protein AHF37_00203 [Paragonimus kellicotti]|nr:hypothetical protein AHF37_00203 [Paragonimus kellicotti]